MPKIVDKDAMRVRIMEAAMQCYATQGFHAAKMSDIAKAAGLAKGTLYLYFKSKDQLTTALVKWIFQGIEQQIMPQREVRTLDGYMTQLRIALDASEETRVETRMFFEVLGPSFGSDEVVAEVAGFFERVGAHNTQQLEHMIRTGEVRSDIDPEATGRSIAALIDGMVTHRAMFGLGDARYRAMMETTLDMIRRGLENREV
ncbi:TetR/AcrR family transcriptional regulator [Profundibacter sp.]|uniref:TetR/AcrR family transcriptional regulator n=1 Tax=Profundibacter sp. TaxID=3101071 RepID=UPI003D14E21D